MDEAKARTLNVETEAKAWTLEAKVKTKDTNLCPRGSSRLRPVIEDYITPMDSKQTWTRNKTCYTVYITTKYSHA